MTPIELQEELGAEVEYILKDIQLKTADGGMKQIEAFSQELPKRLQNVTGDSVMADEDIDPYPFCVVKIDSGELGTAQSAHEVKTVLVLGVFDDDISCQGHRVILTMIQRIMERFTKDPVLNRRYRINEEAGFNWTLDEEDRHPYYLGALSMTWDMFFVRREDKYA